METESLAWAPTFVSLGSEEAEKWDLEVGAKGRNAWRRTVEGKVGRDLGTCREDFNLPI